MDHSRVEDAALHSHGEGVHLDLEERGILVRSLETLLDLSQGLEFRPLVSERYPNPVALAVYGEIPEPERVRADVERRLSTDPVSVLESALVLLELIAGSWPATSEAVIDDGAFLSQTFATKRQNGWIGFLGHADWERVQSAVDARWRFRLLSGADPLAGLYALLNAVVRYGFVYGRIAPGDSHALGHFVEAFCPVVLVCRGELSDLDATLSLAAMKLGVPALVPPDYPFALGRQVRVDALDELVESLVLFPNVHRLLDLPGVPSWPDYAAEGYAKETFEPAETWGDTPESYYILRKGAVDAGGVVVRGEPQGPMGVVLTVDAEPLDALDRAHIEMRAVRGVSMARGTMARLHEGRLIVNLHAESAINPGRIGEMLITALRREFPRIERVRAEVTLERERLRIEAPAVRAELAARREEAAAATEESVAQFMTCVGCSPFAPDHVCVLTPERPPQCGRLYGQIKTGALYNYDDTSNIHHRVLHSGINSFGVCDKGEAIDATAGEWSGVNQTVSRLSGGRTTRVQLHALDEAPHTGCSCFRLILFQTDLPRPGIGIMARGYTGSAPDGRTWQDLHYALTGKQTPGMAGASPNYLRSARFLAAHGGWENVVWVSPKVAAWMGDSLPTGVRVGAQVGG
jgi:hypothetical protein